MTTPMTLGRQWIAKLSERPAGQTWTARDSLYERFDPRRNHLGLIRLLLALTVALTHALGLGFGHQPAIAGTDLGELAVDAFFVLSGYLMVGSYTRLGSTGRYIWHRFLRIMPGFWVCLLVTALLVAPAIAAIQGRPALSVFSGNQSSFDFLFRNAALDMRQFGIAGLPQNVPYPAVLDGSLWTLFYEALCYASIIALAMIGALRRRWLTLAAVALLWMVTVLNDAGVVSQERLPRLMLMFLVGSVFFLYAQSIPINRMIAAASLVLVSVALIWTSDYRIIAAPAFAYLCLYFVVIRPPRTNLSQDLSYGIYTYHWPIVQLLVVAGFTKIGRVPFTLTVLAASAAVGYVSWHLIEHRALELKDASWTRAGSPHTPRHLSSTVASEVESLGEQA